MAHCQRTGESKIRNATVQRQAVLAVVLALLAALVFVVTANAYVAQRTHDTLTDFDRGTFTFTGLLDIPERDIDSVQLLPVGLTGEMELSSRHLPEPVVDHATIAISNSVYVIGGTDRYGSPRADVLLTSVSDDQGNLSPWQSQAALPDARAGVGLASYRNTGNTSTLYVAGGFDGDYAPTDTVFRAQIDLSSGVLNGDWITDSHRLPHSVDHAPTVEHDGYLYVLGGTGMDMSGYFTSFQEVYAAPVNTDGSLGGAFVETSPLPRPLFYGYAVIYEGEITDTLYYVGGMYMVSRPPPVWVEPLASEEVYFADFLPNGTLTEWKRSEGALPRPLYGHSGVLVNDVELIVTGGIGNPKDPGETLTSTVKAALVDPDNSSFRLYNWCAHVPEPCNLGAWQTGGLLPEVRALHSTVAARDYIYVMGGQDTNQDATDTIFFGSIQGEGALYAPAGEYLSDKIDLGQPATLRKLAWQASIDPPGQVTLTMQYRTSANGKDWSAWSDPVFSQHGLNEINEFPAQGSIQFVQYEADFTTVLTHASPRLDEVHIFYEVPDPDLSVMKHTGSVITVGLGSTLQYTIHYSNTGGWVAENAVVTETLPAYTSYAGGPEWHQVGSSNLYTQLLGNVERNGSGDATFTVKVDDEVPPAVYSITNQVEIDYPPMIDTLGYVITDENRYDNWYQISNPLSFVAMTVTKEAFPPAGEPVTAGSLITYTLRYTNQGVARASQVVLTDTFDDRGTYTILTPSVPLTATEYVWNLGSLGPGQSGEQQMIVQVQDPLPNYEYVTNQASLHSPDDDVYHTPVLTHPLVSSVMTITKEASPPAGQEVTPGSLITYTLRYTNVGATRASQVVLTDTFDGRETYTIVTPPIPPTAKEYVWNLGSLGPGQSGEQQVVVRLQDPLPNHWVVTNEASLYSLGGDAYHTPVITHPVMNLSGTTPAPMVDLIVTNVKWQPSHIVSGTWPMFQTTVMNTGMRDASEHFWVSLYIKPEGSSPPSWPSDHDRGYCLYGCSVTRPSYVEYVDALGAGETLALSFENLSADLSPDFPKAGSYDIYVQIDVAFGGDNKYWGRFAEDREDNNLWHGMLTIEDSGPPKVFLPVIVRSSP
jgi:uncharacterized repeat protein (TIGR01451 family)